MLCRRGEKSLLLLMYNAGLSQRGGAKTTHTSEVQSQRQSCISPRLPLLIP